MKIGLLTFHDADNYGAVLQAFALKETIKKIEENVEIINYKQPYIINDYKIFILDKNNLKTFFKSLLSSLIHLYNRIVKKHKFNSFRKKHMNISKTVFYNANKINAYDIYVVGSDQVWNSKITNKDKTFFLDFCKKNEKGIAYAASIGNDDISEEEKNYIKDNLNNFDYISVREDQALNILGSISDKKVYHVLDPTLLAEKNIWNEFIFVRKIKYKYLLIYRLTDNEEVLKIANQISKKLNLRVIIINDSIRKNPYGFKKIKRIGPIEFLSLFNYASFVVTDSFHGTAFSIIFNKDFITVPHKTRGSRMISLLKLLKLNSRLLTSSDELNDEFDYHIDFKEANKILNIEKAKSFEFLKKSIES